MIRNEAVTVLRLDASQHDKAAAGAAAAIGKVGATGEASAGQIRAAMRSLPAQFTDVATQLAGGQNPMLVLLQQGGQVRDQFGSIGAALRGVVGALGPLGLAAAAVAAVGAVALAAERDARKLADGLALTNNAAGLTADRLQQVADRVAGSTRATVGESKDLVASLASQGTVSARVLESMAVAAQRVADLSDKSQADVASEFAKMTAGVADWAAEHNKAWNFLTAQQYLYIKRLEEQGKAEEAAIFTSKLISGQLEAQSRNLGNLESAWESIAKAASRAWSAMLGWGKQDSVNDQLEAARTQLARVEGRLADAKNSPLPAGPAGQGVMQREREELRQRIANLQEQQRMEERLADSRSASAQRERDKIKALREADKPKGASAKDKALAERIALFGRVYGGASGADLAQDDFRRSELAGTDAVNQAMRDAATKRQADQQRMLAELVKANEDANLQLIQDDQQRAQAQITLERKRLQAQIDEVYGNSPARAEAEAAADAAAQAKRQAVAAKFTRDTALVTREETRDALAAAFRDTKNPLKAFGDALGNIVFQRVSTSLADALLSAAFGPGGGFGGGLLGGLLGGLGGLASPAGLLAGATGFGDYNLVADLAGQRAAGGPVQAGKAYLVGERGPEVVRMGSQGGTVVPNSALGGANVTIVQHNTFGAGVSPAELAPMLRATKESAKAEMLQALRVERIA